MAWVKIIRQEREHLEGIEVDEKKPKYDLLDDEDLYAHIMGQTML